MSDEEEYSLLMPFVVVESKDGPFDDGSYTAGFEMGTLYARCETCEMIDAVPTPFTIRHENVPQADLIAMRFGFTMTAVRDDEFPEWRLVSFERAG